MQFISFSTVVLLASALSVNALPTPAPEGAIAILATRTPQPASDGLFPSTIDEVNEALEKRAALPPPTGELAPVLNKIKDLKPKKGAEIQGLRGPQWNNVANKPKGPVPFENPTKKSSWLKPWSKIPKSGASKRPVWINSAHPPQPKPQKPYKSKMQKFNPFKNGMFGGKKAPKDTTPAPGTPKDTTPGTPKDTTPGTSTPETPRDTTPGTSTPGTPRDGAAPPPPQ
ncbi:hypothetical protein HYFRA_00006891 [Hymenoscyphus fraxineus]|uniref:Uncharacterized protein n=1 Tax=Hymenoscyphus fraxineus TaxID=746836 RepID=A0A9N9KPI0_9HELO|nr:hypothetical protein HYFRA_00006891 [Hymenoscyphus fraxineus]